MIWLALIAGLKLNAEMICPRPINVQNVKSLPLEEGMAFFLRASLKTREVSFATFTHGASQARTMNLENGVITPLNGDLDPVLSPDGKLVSMPQNMLLDLETGIQRPGPQAPDTVLREGDGFIGSTGGQRIKLSLDEAKRQKKKVVGEFGIAFYTRDEKGQPKLAHFDPELKGGYQSLAALRASPLGTTYRVMYQADDNLKIRDLSLDVASGKMEPGGPVRNLCTQKLNYALPVLSHDGREFTYYDYESGKTRVMAVEDSGSCREVDWIPALVGKPDFSPDGRRLAFHIDQSTTNTNYFATPDRSQQLGVYLYDRDVKKLSLLKSEPGVNSYYPTFISDHELAYVRSKNTDGRDVMSIEIMKLGNRTGGDCRGCDGSPALRATATMLGALVGMQCGLKVGITNAAVGLIGLSPESCQEFVNTATYDRLRSIREQLNVQTESTSVPKGSVKEVLPLEAVRLLDLRAMCARLEVPASATPPTGSAH